MASKLKISDIKLPVLKPENYTEWKIKITSLLKSRELYDYVEHDPDDETKNAEDYTLANEEAKTIIYSSLDGKTTQACGICDTAHSLWTKVNSYFEGSKEDLTGLAVSRFMELTINGDEKINDFIGRFEIALNNLISTQFVVSLTLMIYVLSKNMPQNIKDGIKVWRTINPNGDINGLLSHIRANYREEENKSNANAFAFLGYSRFKNSHKRTQERKHSSTSGTGGNSRENNDSICTYCKRSGHIWKECYKLKSDNEKKKSTKHRAMMAIERSFHLYDQYLPREGTSSWIIDSGATSHMTNGFENLSNYTRLVRPIEIQTGAGEVIRAIGKGWIFFRGKDGPMVLKDVLYVPNMVTNLFSVKSALAEGYDINFSKDGVIVKQQDNIINTYYDGVLFTIELNIIQRNTTERIFAACSIEDWHKKFGHCGTNLIKRMKKDNLVEGLDIGESKRKCHDCLKSKGIRKSHPSRSSIQANSSLAVVHFDTVDMTVPSLGDKRYFVLGTEEYSGYKLIDFVAKKGSITNCVKLIINTVSLNSKRPVACIYSDNGTEFVNNDLKNWLSERGIIHEVSTPYNAEQNGRAEASNKTVIYGARTALLSSGLPKSLWAEACAATTYVLNRLPSLEQSTKTRYELFFGCKPNVGNLHEFGEEAYRLIPKSKRVDKLSSVAKSLRFVGYTSRYNTFRLYDEESGKIYIDCNVQFTNRQPSKADTPVVENEYTTIGWENVIRPARTSPNQSSTAKPYMK